MNDDQKAAVGFAMELDDAEIEIERLQDLLSAKDEEIAEYKRVMAELVERDHRPCKEISKSKDEEIARLKGMVRGLVDKSEQFMWAMVPEVKAEDRHAITMELVSQIAQAKEMLDKGGE